MASEENNVSGDTKVEAKPTETQPEKKVDVEEASPPAEEAKKDEAAPAPPAPAPPKPTVHKIDFEKDMVYLYQFSRTPVIPSLSPYCLKVEAWLRLTGIKYENVDHKTKFRSKNGQLPFIELNGEEIADSSLIIKELSKRFGKDLDAGMTDEQKIYSHALTSMIENNLLWVIMWWKTKYPDNVLKGYKVNLQHALGSKMPNRLLTFFFKIKFGRKGARKVKAQGLGLHKTEDIIKFGETDLKALSEKLGDKSYFFGDEPTTLDVVAFSNLAQIYFLSNEISFPLRDYMQENCANLVEHVKRMKERCFPDWDEMCANLDLNSHLPKPPPEEKQEKEAKDEKSEKEGEKDEKGKEADKEIEKGEKEEKEVEKKVDENKTKDEKEAAK